MLDNKNLLIMEKTNIVQDIKSKTTLILGSKTHVNYLIDLLQMLSNEDPDICNAAQRGLVKIFMRFLQTKELIALPDDTTSISEYRIWLKECYIKAKEELAALLGSTKNSECQIEALANSMKLLSFSSLMSETSDVSNIILRYQEYLEYEDIKYFTLKSIKQILESKAEKISEDLDIFIINTHTLVTSITLPVLGRKPKRRKQKEIKLDNHGNDQVTESVLLCDPVNPETPKLTFKYETSADTFASVWLKLLSYKLPPPLYRKVLLKFDERVLPHFRNPLSLTDFLINAFNIGGSVSLLSLSSLYILMQKCNLEYPEFYTKLYSLLDTNILYVKYRAKFFFWADIFLTSTHLPAYLVASFIKRASRLTLVAPVDALIILIPFIGNMLIRHQSLLEELVNKTDNSNISSDPFTSDEPDPSKTNALDSSLWELKTLQKHWHPRVAKDASFINKQLPKLEFDLSDILETSFEELFEEVEKAEIRIDEPIKVNHTLVNNITRQFLGNKID